MLAERVTRRRVLGWLGGLGLAALIPGCADDSDDSTAEPTTTTMATTTTTATPDCTLTPELTEGPYYLDLDLMRREIGEGRPGLPLELAVIVVDGDTCEPVEDAIVDVWHCDAEGVYSGVQGSEGTFCRGVQVADSSGTASFETVFPGWYQGRAVHIHLKVIQGGQTWTGQLFFDDETLSRVYALDPYADRGPADTSNDADSIFGQSGGTTIVSTDVGDDRASGRVTLGIERA